MRITFFDESGYTRDWITSIREQPYYVLSAISIPCENLHDLYRAIKSQIADYHIPINPHLLGHGFEIKAKRVIGRHGYWRTNADQRDGILRIMLSTPSIFSATAFIVIIDKKAHFEKYIAPDDPYILALKYSLERIEQFCSFCNDFTLCLYDQNRSLEDTFQQFIPELRQSGSRFTYYNYLPDGSVSPFTRILQFNHILELGFTSSKNSIGIQLADFFVSFTNRYLRLSEPNPCEWWTELIYPTLYQKNGLTDGYGYKRFPE